MKTLDSFIKEIEKELSGKTKISYSAEIGEVVEVKDEVVTAVGLQGVAYGELVEFARGEKGYVIDLQEDLVGIIVLDEFEKIKAGEEVKATGRTLSVGVSEKVIGRVVDPLLRPIDGREPIPAKKYYPVERLAPGVVYRKPVNVPLQTGIKAIDALIPIGRGQRELIIGDRNTGKTTVAIDTILNQKDQDVICIYCSVGQRESKLALVIDLLERKGAMDYTVVVAANASDPVSLQFLAPYAATAIGEYFMDQGKDVLVIYDDLSKHAWAYRQISLVLRRPAGREAYPGDIFYLHSRLLERACRLDEKYGGGSLTALPIIETLEGDVSAYIPTNVISITDGQIYLERDLFNKGIKPAINVGTSVSRVGSSAQTKAIKKVASRLKLDLAQYREMAAFSQFESELDEETRKFLNRGAKITQVLIQEKNQPYDLASEVIVIWAATKGYLDEIELSKVKSFEKDLLELFELEAADLKKKINKEKIFDEEDEKKMQKLVKKVLEKYKVEK